MNMENIDHDFAVATLKATKQQVRLLIGRQSYSTVDGSPAQPATAPVAQPTQGLTLCLLCCLRCINYRWLTFLI